MQITLISDYITSTYCLPVKVLLNKSCEDYMLNLFNNCFQYELIPSA